MVVFKMRDSVPSGSYSSVCNVLRQWKSRSSLLIMNMDCSSLYMYIRMCLFCFLQVIGLINQAQLEHKSEKLECLRQV